MTSVRKMAIVLACLAAAGVARAAEIKVGVFDFQRVSEETARGQQLRALLETFGDKKKGEIVSKEDELKTMEDQYKAQAFSLSPDKRSQMEKDMQKKQLDLQSFRDNAQREMQIEVNAAQSKFNEQLVKIINSLGKERGYTLVFAKEQVVFAADAADMTSEVIERFNQETAKDAPAAGGAGSAPAPPAAPKPAPKPSAANAEAPKPDAAKPDAAKPDAAKPDAAKPDAAKPDAAKPNAAKPKKP